jgi:phosphatidylserine/phosphatidylglycerophosphate/cardiolipin synthase-like enzyme
MHHKFAVFDRRSVLTGSYNWTRSAFRANQENTILTEDPTLVRLFEGEFERLWRRFSS